VTFPANEGAVASLHSLAALAFPLDDLEMAWDGDAALRTCSTAAEFRKIAFERQNDSDPDTAAHWVLPHHPNPDGAPGNADPAGVTAALQALHGARSGSAPDLVQSVSAVEAHLQAHQAEASSEGAGKSSTADEARFSVVLTRRRILASLDEEDRERARRLSGIEGR
jgi:hypothetical protein